MKSDQWSILITILINLVWCNSLCTQEINQDIEVVIRSLVWINKNVSILSEFKADNAYMMLLEDDKENKFLIKQKKKYTEIESVPNVILEVLSAYVAGQLKVPSQVVWIIPATLNIVGKKNKNRVASLHSYIPNGQEYTKDLALRGIFNECRIAPCPDNSLREIFSYLSKKIKLVSLFALDTFVGIRGRRKKNILYVKKEDTCYAIDMGSAFKINYAAIINQVIQSWIKKRIIFNKEEQKALKLYKEVLQEAVNRFSSEYLVQLLDGLFEKAATPINKEKALGKIEEMIKQIYQSNISLINTLNKLIETF